jgi:hypothetical protein
MIAWWNSTFDVEDLRTLVSRVTVLCIHGWTFWALSILLTGVFHSEIHVTVTLTHVLDKALSSLFVDEKLEIVWKHGLMSILFHVHFLQKSIWLESVLSGLITQEVLGLNNHEKRYGKKEKWGCSDHDEKDEVIQKLDLSQCHICWEEEISEWAAVINVLEEVVEYMVLLGLLHHLISYRQLNIGEANIVYEDKVSPHGQQKHVENGMVSNSDAGVDPLAMVIKSIDALVADIAVSWILRSQNLTCWANVARVEILVKLQKGNSFWLLNSSRILAGGIEEEKVGDKVHSEHVIDVFSWPLKWENKY